MLLITTVEAAFAVFETWAWERAGTGEMVCLVAAADALFTARVN